MAAPLPLYMRPLLGPSRMLSAFPLLFGALLCLLLLLLLFLDRLLFLSPLGHSHQCFQEVILLRLKVLRYLFRLLRNIIHFERAVALPAADPVTEPLLALHEVVKALLIRTEGDVPFLAELNH